MARIYRCDNCGREIPKDEELVFTLTKFTNLNEAGKFQQVEDIGQYCTECMNKITRLIAEGVN